VAACRDEYETAASVPRRCHLLPAGLAPSAQFLSGGRKVARLWIRSHSAGSSGLDIGNAPI
jgi:hypothetical protein